MLVLGAAGCQSESPQPAPQVGTPERDRRDSILGESQLPGASAVQRARATRDTLDARAADLDSIRD